MNLLPEEPPDRFVLPATRERLDKHFAFPPDRYRQDWEIELSDGTRLDEFVAAYSALNLTGDEQFALMALIIASADEAMVLEGLPEPQWQKIHEFLVLNPSLHASTMFYWSCVGAACMDECCAITERIREVWNQVFPSNPQMPCMPPGIG